MVLECVPGEIRQEGADLFICNLFNDVVNKNKERRRRNCLLKHVAEGKYRREDMTGRETSAATG